MSQIILENREALENKDNSISVSSNSRCTHVEEKEKNDKKETEEMEIVLENLNNSSDSLNKNSPNSLTDYEDSASYENLIALKKQISYLEKEILEKKKIESKIYMKMNTKEHIKPMYRSFDEFYEYKKNFEEQENKIKNETWKLLSGVKHTTENEDLKKKKENEKYSYIKLKSEQHGKVKQLKEFFQKIEEEKKEKRKNALFIKNAPKKINHFKKNKNEGNIIPIKISLEEDSEKKNGDTHLKTFSVNSTNVEEINNERSNKEEEEEESVSSKSNGKYVEASFINKVSLEKVDNGKETETCAEKEDMNCTENVSAKEIELLLELISEMKKNYERDETYILSLIKQLENSNKHHMVESLLDLLKLFKAKDEEVKKIQEGDVKNNTYNRNDTENSNSIINDELLKNLTHYENKLIEIERRIMNVELKNENKIKETKKVNETEIEVVEKTETNVLISQETENKSMDNVTVSTTTASNQDDLPNDIDNSPRLTNDSQNVESENLKKKKKKSSNKKKAKNFDWFYKSMKNLGEENLQIFNEHNTLIMNKNDSESSSENDSEENMNTTMNVDTQIKYCPSDESHLSDGNDEMFSWLKEKDVELVLNQTKENK